MPAPGPIFTVFPALRIPQCTDMDKTWDVILAFVNHVLKRPFERFSAEDMMKFYTVVYNYCNSTVLQNVEKHGRSGASLAGFQLFNNLRKTFEDHVRIVMTHTDGLRDDELLHCYMHEWHRYNTSIQRLRRPFDRLEKAWIQPEREQDRMQEIYSIDKLLLSIWGKIFVEHVQEDDSRLTKALIRLTIQDRAKKIVNIEILRNILKTLVSVGLTAYDPNLEWLEIYEFVFENPFIETTLQHYDSKSNLYLSESNIYDYLREAEIWCREEENRMNRYDVHPKTRTLLMLKCRKVLFYRVGDLIRETYLGLPEPDGCTWEEEQRAKRRWWDRRYLPKTKECNMSDGEKFRFLYALLSRIPGCEKFMLPEDEVGPEEPDFDFIPEPEPEPEPEHEEEVVEENEGEDSEGSGSGTERGVEVRNEEEEGNEVQVNRQEEEVKSKGGREGEESLCKEEIPQVDGTEVKKQDKREVDQEVKEEESIEPRNGKQNTRNDAKSTENINDGEQTQENGRHKKALC